MKPKPIHVLSILVLVSITISGFATFKLVQIEDQVASIETERTEQLDQQFKLPTGAPANYGDELDVEYQDVSQKNPKKAEETIQTFASYDNIEMSEKKHQRYIDILYDRNGGISCEYCCEAESVITKEGKPGCGCAHAVAMRGLTKYLLENHGEEMTDEEIFEEVSKWKTRYFPAQTKSKAKGLQEQGTETTFVNLASNEFRGVSSKEGGWVGDC